MISPNGKTAYGTSLLPSDMIIPINLATGTAGKPIRVPGGGQIAFTPDGKTAYVLHPVYRGFSTLTPINTATNTPGRPIRVGAGADQIAFTPDGRTAYVAGMGTVTPVSTATGTPGRPIRIDCCSVSIAITPDGKTVYVGTAEGRVCQVVPISTATGTAGKPVRLGSRPPEEMAMAPDGKTVYIANPEGPSGAVVPISTATSTAGKPIGIGQSVTIAIPPGGKNLVRRRLEGSRHRRPAQDRRDQHRHQHPRQPHRPPDRRLPPIWGICLADEVRDDRAEPFPLRPPVGSGRARDDRMVQARRAGYGGLQDRRHRPGDRFAVAERDQHRRRTRAQPAQAARLRPRPGRRGPSAPARASPAGRQ